MTTQQRRIELQELSNRIDRQRFQIQKVYADMKKSVRPEIHKALSRRNMAAVPDADDATAQGIYDLSADKNNLDNRNVVSGEQADDDRRLADNIYDLAK
jgi:hypothetical protein